MFVKVREGKGWEMVIELGGIKRIGRHFCLQLEFYDLMQLSLNSTVLLS